MNGSKSVHSVKPDMIGRTQGRRVPVFVRVGLREALNRYFRGIGQIEIVTDSHVSDYWLSTIVERLRLSEGVVHSTILPAGEKSKNAKTISRLHDQWFSHRCDRSTPVIALGGGVIGDTVGFAAATFLRGLPLWQVPTTLLAQVDAAIGGKVGINHARGKNLIGCFYQPAGILIDPGFLGTLPSAELISGLAEVVKYGVISDPVLFNRCERDLDKWISGRNPIPDAVIRKCVRIKLRVVAADETDSGLRRTLNFGHTLGHALERWAKYRFLRHGEAVAIGMVGAAFIARRKSLFGAGEFDRLLNVCHRLVPVGLRNLSITEVARHLTVDKKRAQGRNIWILPRAIGTVEVTDKVTEKDVRDAIGFLNEWMNG